MFDRREDVSSMTDPFKLYNFKAEKNYFKNWNLIFSWFLLIIASRIFNQDMNTDPGSGQKIYIIRIDPDPKHCRQEFPACLGGS